MVPKDYEIKEKVKEWGGIFATERYVEDFEVTPEIAKYFLSKMGRNRNLKPNRVQQYKNDILNDNFVDSPGLICFDYNGELKDGQHRLNAIIKADKPVHLSLKFGFSPNAIFDKNAVRTTMDTFRISGLTDSKLANKSVIAIVNVIIQVRYGNQLLKGTTDQMKADFCNAYQEELVEAVKISNSGTNKGICAVSAVGAAIFAAIVFGIPESDLIRFAKCANTLYSNGDYESSAITFAKQIEGLSARGTETRATIESTAEMAISDFIKGKPRYKKYTVFKTPFLQSIDYEF